MSSYEVVFLISGILETYAKYNFIQAFCGDWKGNQKLELLFFSSFYFISSGVYLIFDIPVLNMMIIISFLFVMGILRGIGIKRTMLSTLLIVTISIALESAVVFVTGYTSGSIVSEAQYSSEFGLVVFVLLEYIVSIGIARYRNLKRDVEIPMSYWGVLLLFPVASLFLLGMIFRYSIYSSTEVAIGTSVILLMNVLLFTIYDRLILLYEGKVRELVLRHLNSSYKKQFELMKQSVVDLRGFRHDMNSHVVAMEGLLRLKDYEAIQNYINKVKKNISNEYLISNTRNIVIDSVINFEITQSKVVVENVRLKAMNIPLKINIQDFDMTIVFSNLLSNALTAAEKAENGIIEITIKYEKGVFFVIVENDFRGMIKEDKSMLKTTKGDKINHGIGLNNVKKVVERYKGDLLIDYNEDKFRVEISMYERADE